MAIETGGITRRAFFESGVGAVAAAGVLTAVNPVAALGVSEQEVAKPHAAPFTGKIALEEHFGTAETMDASYSSPALQIQLGEIGDRRIAEMDRGGVEICILSLVAPGIQAIPDPAKAIAVARRANDHLAEQIARNPKRFKGFAALPLQDPQAGARS